MTREVMTITRDQSSKRIYLKIHEHKPHYMIALCDENLLGKTLKKGEVKFVISEEFYGGSLVDPKDCLQHFERATIANLVGQQAVQLAIDAGYVHKNAVIYIEGHPHAQWVKL